MASSQLTAVLRQIRALAAGPGAEATDADLLDRFIDQRDEVAFAQLVRRHGPLISGLCQRMLADVHDAEDVFQATFLVLARKASTIRKRQSVGSWLYGVACRLARRARADRHRRRTQEVQAMPMSRLDPLNEVAWKEFLQAVDAEVQHLPEKYRQPVVLCYLGGQTNEQAAQQLGCPVGTVKIRLARARQLLSKRLTRKGLLLSAGLVATLETVPAAPAAVPTALIQGTTAAAVAFAGGTVAGLSASVLQLAHEALPWVLSAKTKVAALVVGASFLTLGASVLAWSGKLHVLPGRGAAVAAAPMGNLERLRQLCAEPDGDPLSPTVRARMGAAGFPRLFGAEAIALAPNGKLVARGRVDQPIRLIDLPSGREVGRLQGHEAPLRFAAFALAFSPDGQTLAAGSHRDGSIHLWDVTTGHALGSISEALGAVCPLGFSPNGHWLAAGDAQQESIKVWNVKTRKLVATIAGCGPGPCFAFSPDSKTLAAAGGQTVRVAPPGSPPQWKPAVRIWDLAAGKERTHFVHESPHSITALRFVQGGRVLVSGESNGVVRMRDVASGRELHQQVFDGCPVLLSPTGSSAILDSGIAEIQVRIGTVGGQTLHDFPPRATAVALSPGDGNQVLVAFPNEITVWNPARREPLHVETVGLR